MTLTSNTRFNLGDPVYFLNVNHEITKGFVTRIDCNTIVYKDSYTGEQKSYNVIKYDVVTNGEYTSDIYVEECLYSTPEEIIAMFNDQIEQGNFD